MANNHFICCCSTGPWARSCRRSCSPCCSSSCPHTSGWCTDSLAKAKSKEVNFSQITGPFSQLTSFATLANHFVVGIFSLLNSAKINWISLAYLLSILPTASLFIPILLASNECKIAKVSRKFVYSRSLIASCASLERVLRCLSDKKRIHFFAHAITCPLAAHVFSIGLSMRIRRMVWVTNKIRRSSQRALRKQNKNWFFNDYFSVRSFKGLHLDYDSWSNSFPGFVGFTIILIKLNTIYIKCIITI